MYGSALGVTWQWLNESLATVAGDEEKSTGQPRADRVIDFGINGLSMPADADARGLFAPKANAPILLPSHLDAWVQTSPRPTPDPDVALWLHGPERGTADVQVVWRADLDAEILRQARDGEGSRKDRAREVALGTVDILPPASGEAVSVPFASVKRWLEGRPEPEMFDVEGAPDAAADDDWKTEPERVARPAVAWRGEASEVIDAAGLKPGDTIVVPAVYGGIASGTWPPAATAPVVDLAEVAALRQRGRAVLRLHPAVLDDLFGGAAPAPPAPQPLDAEDLDDRARVLEWLVAVRSIELTGDAKELVDRLEAESGKRGFRVDRFPVGADGGENQYFLIRGRRRQTFDEGEVSTEDDLASFTGLKVSLAEHLGGVSEMVGEFAQRVGLPAELAADIRLAARLHDLGKADSRFQRLLQGGSEFKTLVESEPLAKSAVPVSGWRAQQLVRQRSGYPPGARHEVMSVALMESADAELATLANDWALVLHLVASHHGRCRPLVPWVADSDPVEVKWKLDGVVVSGSSAHELARLDSGVGERFWTLVRRYGWWGLAWLEAILRLADHRRSESEQRPSRGAA